MSEITFNPETHEIRRGGIVMPSVTQAIPRPEFRISKSRLEQKRLDGVDLHSMLKAYLDTGNAFDPIIEQIGDWIESNRSSLGDVVEYEKFRFDEKHLFGGTPDIVFEKAVVDLKSSFYSPRIFSLQLAGYSILSTQAIRKTRKWFVIYPEKGKIRCKNVFDDRAEKIFIECVRRWHSTKAIELYLRG